MDDISFRDKIRSEEILFSDGATGTNLQGRGLQRGTPSEAWLFEKPDDFWEVLDVAAQNPDIVLELDQSLRRAQAARSDMDGAAPI